MRLAACNDDQVALGHAKLSSVFEREGSRAATDIVEQGVGTRRQRQTPGVAEFEVEQQRPTKANAIEHFGEYVQIPMLIRRTIGHNSRTVEPYRPRPPDLLHVAAGQRVVRHFAKRPLDEPRLCTTTAIRRTHVRHPTE